MKSFITTFLLLSIRCYLANAQCIETKCPVVNRLYCQADSLEKGVLHREAKLVPEYIKALNKLYSARVAARECEGGKWIPKIDDYILAISTKVDSLRQAAEKATIKAKEAENLSEQSKKKALRAAQQADRSARVAKQAARAADSSARITEASRLITLAIQFKQDDPTLALQLIKKACDTSYYQSKLAVQELQAILSKTPPASYYKKKTESGAPISCMAMSGDGQRLILGHNDGTLRLWTDFQQLNGTQNNPLSFVTAHKGGILSLAISYDGNLIVSGGVDGRILVWVDKELQRTLQSEKSMGPVLSVALSTDRRYVVSSHENRSVIIWDLQSGNKVIKKKALPFGNALQVCFSPNGRYVGIAGNDETVQVWDWQPDQLVATMEKHRGAVRSVAFSPDGNYIASGGDDKVVRIWKWQQNPVSTIIPAVDSHQQPVLSVCFSPVTDFLVSASQDNTIKVWTLRNDSLVLLRTLKGHQKPVFAVGFYKNSAYVYSGSYDHSVKVWNWQEDFSVPDSLRSTTTFPALTAQAHLNKTSGAVSQRIVRDEKSCRLMLPSNLLGVENPFFFSFNRRYILAQDNERGIWLWDYNRTNWPIFRVYTSRKEPFSLSEDNTLLKSGQRRYRNLYDELMNGQLIPPMTDEDRAKYLMNSQ